MKILIPIRSKIDFKHLCRYQYSSLEDKLIRVVAYTELFAEYSQYYHLALEERWRKDAIIRKGELEEKREAEREQEKIKQLINDAEAFD